MSFEQDRTGYNKSLPRPVDTTMGDDLRGPTTGGSNVSDDISRRMDAALNAPYSVDKLLNRLKQSIYSARNFSDFLKERSSLEHRYGQGYKKLVFSASDSIKRPEGRQGSYARNFEEALRVNDRLAENSLSFANTLHTMAEELRDTAENAEKGRKHWKHTAMDHEKRVAEAENAQAKAKDRYNNAAEQYERARTGERQGGKFGLKNKSPAQQEEALKEKTDLLGEDYNTRSEAAQREKRDFDITHRPQIVKSLSDLVHECDAAVAMHMAKLASISEKHVVSNGMAIAPIKTGDGLEPRGLRQIAQSVDDRKDFQDYMLDGLEPSSPFKTRSRKNTDAELVHTPMHSVPAPIPFSAPHNGIQGNRESTPPQLPQIGTGKDDFGSSFESPRPPLPNNNSFIAGQQDSVHGPAPPPPQAGVTSDSFSPYGAGRGTSSGPSLPSYDRGQALPQEPTLPDFDRSQAPPANSYHDRPDYNRNAISSAATGTTQSALHDMPGAFPGRGQPTPNVYQDSGRGQPAPSSYLDAGRSQPAPDSYQNSGKGQSPYSTAVVGSGQPPPATRNLPSQQLARPTLPPNRPVFGMHLDYLFRRDGAAVPNIVFQCIQAVDMFGLDLEGIYRVSGSPSTVVQLKSEFDHDSSAVRLDDREAFNNDIAGVATLLKTFLRDLQDPLLTEASYQSFIQAAKYEDNIMRRDALHQYINGLPDPNYATLRVLTLHLHRVSTYSDVNKMDMRNLAIVFGPTVMGGSSVADANWQTKVMETLLQHTHDIFDPDE